MEIKDSLLPEFDHEMATTRRLLERVPDEAVTWKPHEKSMSLGQLSVHLSNLPLWCSMTLDRTFLELDDVGSIANLTGEKPRAAIVERFDRHLAAARARLSTTTDAEFLTPWTLKQGGQEIFTLPRISALRSFVMNHMIHHRGQLTVYLRLRNVPLPPIYGPTADEQ